MQQKEKELQIVFYNSLIRLVSRVGIEPATYGLRVKLPALKGWASRKGIFI